MNKKTKKEIQELVKEMIENEISSYNNVKSADEDNCSYSYKAELEGLIDAIGKKDLFVKVTSKLPEVYNVDNPYEIYQIHEWLLKLTRKDLIKTTLSKEEYAFFDELGLHEIKKFFAVQLSSYYYAEVNRVKALHTKILKEYYNKKEK